MNELIDDHKTGKIKHPKRSRLGKHHKNDKSRPDKSEYLDSDKDENYVEKVKEMPDITEKKIPGHKIQSNSGPDQLPVDKNQNEENVDEGNRDESDEFTDIKTDLDDVDDVDETNNNNDVTNRPSEKRSRPILNEEDDHHQGNGFF